MLRSFYNLSKIKLNSASEFRFCLRIHLILYFLHKMQGRGKQSERGRNSKNSRSWLERKMIRYDPTAEKCLNFDLVNTFIKLKPSEPHFSFLNELQPEYNQPPKGSQKNAEKQSSSKQKEKAYENILFDLHKFLQTFEKESHKYEKSKKSDHSIVESQNSSAILNKTIENIEQDIQTFHSTQSVFSHNSSSLLQSTVSQQIKQVQMKNKKSLDERDSKISEMMKKYDTIARELKETIHQRNQFVKKHEEERQSLKEEEKRQREKREELEVLSQRHLRNFNKQKEQNREIEAQKQRLKNTLFELKSKANHLEHGLKFVETKKDGEIADLQKKLKAVKLDENDTQSYTQELRKQKFEIEQQLRLLLISFEKKEEGQNISREERQQQNKVLRAQLKEEVERECREQFQKQNLTELTQIIISLQGMSSQLKKKYAEVQEANKNIIQENITLKNTVSQMERQADKQFKLEQKINELSHQMKILGSHQQKQLQIKSKRNQLLRNEEKYRNEIDELEQKVSQLESKNKQLREEFEESEKQNSQLKQKLYFSESLVEQNQIDIEELTEKLKRCEIKQKEQTKTKTVPLNNTSEIKKLQSEIIQLKSTLFTVSSILELQPQKRKLLLNLIQHNTKSTIVKTSLQYKYDPNHIDFSHYLNSQSHPLLILLKLSNTNNIIGFYSSGIKNQQNNVEIDSAFVFSLEGQGCVFNKSTKNNISAVSYLESKLVLGNSELVIKNKNTTPHFQLSTAIIGSKVFNIPTASALIGKTKITDSSVRFEEFEIHQIHFQV